MILLSMITLALVNRMASAVTYSCPINQVLAISSQSDKEIDMNALQAPICGQSRTCVYTRGAPCTAKGQYLAGVRKLENGEVLHSCCQYSPPVKEHQSDVCREYVIESVERQPVTTRGPNNPFQPGGPRPPAGGAGSGHQDPETVDIILKDTGPGQPVQLVKAIKKLKGSGHDGYTVTVCTPQCDRSTTTRRPTTPRQKSNEKKTEPKQEEAPKKGLFGRGGGNHCFSKDMTVMTPQGTKRMDEIKAGDEVMVSTVANNPTFEPVEWLYHRDPNVEAEFITVTTKSRRVLRLSPNHLIPFVPCSDRLFDDEELDQLTLSQTFFARRLQVGQCVASQTEHGFQADPIESIVRERMNGIFSPITTKGTIVVNGVYTSCYSSVENQLMQKTVHTSLIKARHAVSMAWNSIFGSTLAHEDADVPTPLKMLLSMAHYVLPSNVFKGGSN